MICRQTFLCTSNKGKLDEHIEGKHAGKATFEVSQRTLDLTGLCEPEHYLPDHCWFMHAMRAMF